jgi:mono/diheme cytochrome c family protein
MKITRSKVKASALVAAAVFKVSTLLAADLVADVSAIFANSCIDCHSQTKGRIEKKLDLTDLVAVAGSQRIINRESVEAGKLYQEVNSGDMPYKDDDLVHKQPLTDKEKNTIIEWIKQGAPLPQGSQDASGRFISTKTTINEIFRICLRRTKMTGHSSAI